MDSLLFLLCRWTMMSMYSRMSDDWCISSSPFLEFLEFLLVLVYSHASVDVFTKTSSSSLPYLVSSHLYLSIRPNFRGCSIRRCLTIFSRLQGKTDNLISSFQASIWFSVCLSRLYFLKTYFSLFTQTHFPRLFRVHEWE